MTDHHSLQHVFDEAEDALNDFERAGFQDAESVFQRFIAIVEREPLTSLITSLTPRVDYATWFAAALQTQGGMVGSGRLNWPLDRAERVSMMREMFRAIKTSEEGVFGIAHVFTYGGGGQIASDYRAFSQKIARPFLRDLGRLVNLRVAPPVLSEAIARPFPPSGDATLDDLLVTARDRFREPDPATRRAALEKLWDGWERLKTLDGADKKAGVAQLLDRAAGNPPFRAVLEAEAQALTNIGNDFEIRHFETSRNKLESPAHVDYLFHRMWALIWLTLLARGAPK